MQHNITTMDDVRAFIALIASEIDNFHILTDFTTYVYPHSYFRRYTDEEAEQRNKCLEQCLSVCEIYTEDCFSYLEWYYRLVSTRSSAQAALITANQYTRNSYQLPLFGY